MSQENVDAVRKSLEGWNRGDLDALLEHAHPQVEWYSEIVQRLEGSGSVYRGVDEMRRYWDEWHALWDVTIEVTEVRDLGDTVLALARLKTHGEASGIDLESPIAYVFEFEEGLARTVRAYLNPHEAFEAVGLS